ncbi:hypothetical protein [Mumia zhuanghuii]|uniref:Uncharacterized protein n=1 Tax=Mumia zhuanghuii TaxID=2585211 RepID=A0A5C4LZJ7_9ACTN|nr:hypothetical protein [Mumia zhuanghuii]TNC22700.1 hypothetical protein FHE65_35685 [Mumia zhuanghuii]
MWDSPVDEQLLRQHHQFPAEFAFLLCGLDSRCLDSRRLDSQPVLPGQHERDGCRATCGGCELVDALHDSSVGPRWLQVDSDQPSFSWFEYADLRADAHSGRSSE